MPDPALVPSDSTVVVRVKPWRDMRVWRDIELRLDQTLQELHLAIQRAFELDNDHLYAFYMNGHAFDRVFGVEGRPDDDRPSAFEVSLSQFALPQNKRFLYLFDFGDELRHDLKVISRGRVDSKATYPRVIASEGKAPPQYLDWPVLDEGDEVGEDSATLDENVCGKVPNATEDASIPVAEPMRGELQQLLPRIELAIERQQDRAMGEDQPKARMLAVLTDDYAFACELLDAANGEFWAMHEAVEHATSWSLSGWLRELPNELFGASLHEAAVDLARRVHAVTGSEGLQIQLPVFLARANRIPEARAMQAENLIEFPEDGRVHTAAAGLELAAGDLLRAEFHYREALKWAGTQMDLRESVLDGLKEVLQGTKQTDAIRTLLQQEEAFMLLAFPHLRESTPIRRQSPKVGRNDPCPCGSGKKSKKCCGAAT